MQCGSNRIWDEAGCFVYEVTRSRIFVRVGPSISDNFNLVKNRYFDPKEFVSVDLIRHAREDYYTDDAYYGYGNNARDEIGPFLRLSDGSGWILAKQSGQEFVRRIPVEKASEKVWTFYADNVPFGIELRRHPIEELHNPDDTNRFSPACGGITYLPMQKIVCDRKLCTGNSTFYRVQGTYGWVFDKRSIGESESDTVRYREMMIEGDLVEKGLFAFRINSTNGMAIRKTCHVGDGANCTNVTVKQGDIVVADTIRHSPLDNGNGPFLRLTDGSGWLFFHKHGGSPLLEEIPITSGTFNLKILSSNGIKPRGQPIDSYYYKDQVRAPVLKQDEILECDRKVSSTQSGITFYRKQSTDLWVYDKQDGKTIAEIVVEQGSLNKSLLGKTARNSSNNNNFINDLKHPWSPYYIRGNANGINGLEEIDFDSTRKIISFKSVDDVTINVYFETRMIGIVMSNYSINNRRAQGRTQRFHRNCNEAELQAIFQDPRTYQRGDHRSNKCARLIPSPINTTIFQNIEDRNRGGDSFDSKFASEIGENPITPDASLSSNVEGEQQHFDCDAFDAEQDTRKNLWDCQMEMKNLRYREGNLLRAIQIHEEEHMKEARKMRIRTEQVTAYRIQKEEEEDRRFRFEQQEEIPRRLEDHERRVIEEDRQRRGSSLVFKNVCVGSIVGCFLGLALSPVCGPFLVRQFGLQHLM